MFEDTAKKPSAELRVDTKLAASVRQSFDSLDTGGVSADSVAELLGRINAAVPTNTQSTAKLTDEIARLSVLCQKETEENTNIASRLYREEARVSELQRQLHDAQGKIAYIAKQREQLVGRLQLVETKRREMEEMVRQAELCVDKVDRLDDKVFGMERSLVRMQRQLGKSQKTAGACGSAGSTDNAKTGVLLRYETAKRNRLSSVFSKPALE
ncbi:hypothetical protein BX070DRAFT_82141 [Coemansia spiralis]|nr:hypothetical protein BX070DRAFT_82141 [Coemansia spiralis]